MRRPRFHLHALMVAVAFVALLIAGLRPLTESEIARIGEAKWKEQEISHRFVGRYHVRVTDRGDWAVEIVEDATGEALWVVHVIPSGAVYSSGPTEPMRAMMMREQWLQWKLIKPDPPMPWELPR